MTWSVTEPNATTYDAIYYLVLPTESIVFYDYELGCSAMHHNGSFDSFKGTFNANPLIPVDPHHAMLLGWLTPERMAKNSPYLDKTIQAAIALVVS